MKAVRQNYRPTEGILYLLEDFRCMVNDCVRIGIRENVSSMKSLSIRAYHQLSAYDVPTYYRLTAISRAAGMLRNYRQELKRNRTAMVPYITRLSLTDCYGFRVLHRLVRLPLRRGEFAFSVDRDVNAARNILAKGGVRFTPDGPPEVRKEAVKGNETMTPILRADGGKVTQG